jgi:hypothetical protein
MSDQAWTDDDALNLEALIAVLHAYKDYGKAALRTSDEYTSLTLVRRAIRRLRNKAAGDTR